MQLWEHDPDEIRTMPLDALALLVLDDFDGGWNVDSYFKERKMQFRETFAQPGVHARLAEAWAWLEANVMVGRNPEQDSVNARQITDTGRQALAGGLPRLRAGRRLGVDLHPLIAGRVRTQFLMGEFELAGFAALREVEIRVRALGGFSDDLIGVALMAAAFKPDPAGPLADTTSEKGEQEAVMALFRGAIGTFKNPASHRSVDYQDPTLAAEVVLLADLLLRLLDGIANRRTPSARHAL